MAANIRREEDLGWYFFATGQPALQHAPFGTFISAPISPKRRTQICRG